MIPNESIFDDPIFQDDDDNLESDIIGSSFPHIEGIEYYKSLGYINKGDMIVTPPISKDVHVDHYVIHDKEPGWVSVMNSIAGENNWGCHSGAYTFDLTQKALVYECLPYAEDEMKKANKIMGFVPENDPWIASMRCVKPLDDEDEYNYMAGLFRASDYQEYNVFACCSINEPQSRSIPFEDTGIVFLGVFALDRVESFIQRRIFLHQVSDRMNLK